jgi:UDP-N-acetylglucosamine acyltransferase
MAAVHPTAIVHPDAILADGVEIGPYCVVEAGVALGPGTKLLSHVAIRGWVRVGAANLFHSHCVIGGEPQDLGYDGAETWVTIGDRNTFREGCTVHRATTKADGVTAIGSDNYLMAYAHVGHDCRLGNHLIIANNVMLGGHAVVGDYVGISGGVGVHQFVTIGNHAFIGGLTKLTTDAPPFMLVEGHPSEIRCVNLVGLKRRGYSTLTLQALSTAHRLLYRTHVPAAEARAELQRDGRWTPEVAELVAFVERTHAGRRGRGQEGRRAA